MQEIYVTTPGDFINKINTITKFADPKHLFGRIRIRSNHWDPDPTKKCLKSDKTRNNSINLQRHFFQVYIFFLYNATNSELKKCE